MAKLLNGLPLSVHHASGGDARVRTGGAALQLTGISSGSFQVNGTRYKFYPNMRAANDTMILLGYSSPVTFANASAMVMDMQQYSDDVPEGTTLYFTLISPVTLEPIGATPMDFIYVSFYS